MRLTGFDEGTSEEDDGSDSEADATREHIERLVTLARERTDYLAAWRESRGELSSNGENREGRFDARSLPGASTFMHPETEFSTSTPPGLLVRTARVFAEWLAFWRR